MQKNKNQPENMLDLVFSRSPQFPCKIAKDGIVTILEKQAHPIQKFFRRLGAIIPEFREIELDDYGSFVYRQIDGKKTVREIGAALKAEYGAAAEPLYERLCQYLTCLLSQQHYISGQIRQK